LILGQEAAAREKHDHLGTEHIMFGLLQSPGEVNSAVFKKTRMNLKKLVAQVEEMVEANPATEAKADIPFSEKAKKAIERSVEIAKEYGEGVIGQEHLLLAMIAITDSAAAKAIVNSGMEDLKKLEEAIQNEIESNRRRKKILALLNDQASQALVQAREEAHLSWNDFIGTEHILLGVLKGGDNLASVVLKKLGMDMRLAQKTIKEMTPPGKEKLPDGMQPHFDIEAKQVIDAAQAEAKEMNHNYIGTEHLLLGMLAVKTCAAASALNRTGVSNIKKVRIAISKELEGK